MIYMKTSQNFLLRCSQFYIYLIGIYNLENWLTFDKIFRIIVIEDEQPQKCGVSLEIGFKN